MTVAMIFNIEPTVPSQLVPQIFLSNLTSNMTLQFRDDFSCNHAIFIL
jgi:hypothetical protein